MTVAIGSAARPTNKIGPLGVNNGILIAAGVLAMGAIGLAGFSFVAGVTRDGGLGAPAPDPGVVIAAPDATDGEPADQPDEPGDSEAAIGNNEGRRETNNDGTSDDSGTTTGTGGDDPEQSDDSADSTSPDTSTADQESETTVYIIKPGDTLTAISAATGVSVDKLVAANAIADPDLIYAGSALEIPN